MSERFVLPSGVTVFVEESRAIPIVSLSIALRTGAAHDPAGKDGLARLTTRMLRRGAEGLDAVAIDAMLDRLGAELVVDTGSSSVSMQAQVIGRSLEPFAELLARMLLTPTFPPEELARLRRETLAEFIELRDHDRALGQLWLRRTLFAGHSYARSGAGVQSTVERIEVADLRAFYKKHFVRKNLVLGFAGDVTAAQACAIAERITSGLPSGTIPKDPVREPPSHERRKLVIVDKPDRTQTQILIGTLGTHARDSDHFALTVASAIFGGTFTSRLMQAIRVKRGWSYGASARLAIDRQRQAFVMSTFPAATDAAACIGVMTELFDQLRDKGVSARETTFIQRFITRSHAFEVDTAGKRLHQGLDVELLGLPADYFTSYVERIRAVTPAAANEAVRRRLRSDNLVVVVVATASAVQDDIARVVGSPIPPEVVPFDRP